MAKIIQIIDVDSAGHQVRLDNGFLHTIAHGGQSPQVGEELVEETHAPTIGQLNSPEQEQAQALSEEVSEYVSTQDDGVPVRQDGA